MRWSHWHSVSDVLDIRPACDTVCLTGKSECVVEQLLIVGASGLAEQTAMDKASKVSGVTRVG